MSIQEEMRRDWDERAERDARFFIASGTADVASFWRSGEEELSALILSDVEVAAATRALEIGCGIGRLLRPLAARVADVLGVDISPRMVAAARAACEGLTNVRIEQTDGTLSGTADRSRDFVFSYIVFQHIPERAAIESYVREAARVLRPGGVLHFQVDGRVRRRGAFEPGTYSGTTLSARETGEMAIAAGFSVVRQWGEGTHYLWTTARLPGTGATIRIVPRFVDSVELDALRRRLAASCGEAVRLDQPSGIRTSLEHFLTLHVALGMRELVVEAFRVLLSREPTAPELEYNAGLFDRGLETPGDWIDTIVAGSELRERVTPRIPELPGAAQERLRRRSGAGADESVESVLAAVIEQLKGLDDPGAVRRAYRLVLGREPDGEGHLYFTGKLQTGTFTRFKVVTELLVSEEMRTGVMPTPKPVP